MVQELTSIPSISGRLGHSLGQGISNHVPKEIERQRLERGLTDLGKNPNQDPWQAFTALSSLPGTTPQIIESGTNLLRQRAKGQALINQASQQQKVNASPFQNVSEDRQINANRSPSVTNPEQLSKSIEGFIPPTQDQVFDEAGQIFNANPGRFGGDPDKAIAFIEDKYAREEGIAKANQEVHSNRSAIQDKVIKRLESHATELGAIGPNATSPVPADIYSKIEDEAVNAVKPVKEGGEGLTEHDAMKKYGKKLQEVSRNYADLNSVGNWGITGRPAAESLRNLKNLQSKFEENGDTRNMAQQLIAVNKLSPQLSYAIAEPVSKIPSINKKISSLPEVKRFQGLNSPLPAVSIAETLKIAPELMKEINGKGSPLAIAYELQKKGYDPQIWLDYVNKNKSQLNNLTVLQNDQLSKPLPTVKPWNDWWLQSFTGVQ